jgi:hypothetical protein
LHCSFTCIKAHRSSAPTDDQALCMPLCPARVAVNLGVLSTGVFPEASYPDRPYSPVLVPR